MDAPHARLDAARLFHSAEWRVQAITRRIRAFNYGNALRQDVTLLSSAGYPVAARVVRPEGDGPLPALVVSPAIHHGCAALETHQSIVSATELAALGFVVIVHDPAGRGETWGEEDFGGPEQQDDLETTLRYARARPDVASVGVLSLSFGVVAAAPVLARVDGVRWLVDWEGPSDREVVTTGGTRLLPADGHALDDEEYWCSREAVRHVGRLKCGYVRLQAAPDHAQLYDLRHARRLIDAAQTAPWFQLNNHPRGLRPDSPRWISGGPLAANRAILAKLAELR